MSITEPYLYIIASMKHYCVPVMVCDNATVKVQSEFTGAHHAGFKLGIVFVSRVGFTVPLE